MPSTSRTHIRIRTMTALSACGLCLCLAGCDEQSVEIFRSTDQGEALAAFRWINEYGGHPSRELEGSADEPLFIITVPPNEERAAATLLQELGLPRPNDVAIEPSAFNPSPTDLQLKTLQIRQRELEEQLQLLASVVDARVSLTQATKESTRREEPAPARASVVVTFLAKRDPKELEREVREVVGNGMSQLLANDNLSVVLTPLEPTPISSTQTPPEASSDAHVQSLSRRLNIMTTIAAVLLAGCSALLWFTASRTRSLRRDNASTTGTT